MFGNFDASQRKDLQLEIHSRAFHGLGRRKDFLGGDVGGSPQIRCPFVPTCLRNAGLARSPSTHCFK